MARLLLLLKSAGRVLTSRMVDKDFLAKAEEVARLAECVQTSEAEIAKHEALIAERRRHIAEHKRRLSLLTEELYAASRQYGATEAAVFSRQSELNRHVFVSHHTLPPHVEPHSRRVAWGPEHHTKAPAGEQAASKYDLLLALALQPDFDLGFAALAIYGEDNERARNKVHAGLTHLRARGALGARAARAAPSTLARGNRPSENVESEVHGGPAAKLK